MDMIPRGHDKAVIRARRAGAIAMGLIVGILLLVALIEFSRNVGSVSAFQYQGY